MFALPKTNITTVLIIGAAATSGFAAWKYQEARYKAEIYKIREENTAEKLAAGSKAMQEYFELQRTKDAAIESAKLREEASARAAADAALHADKLRKQLAAANSRIATATREAVNQYAATLGDVFGQCVQEYRGMAEKATGHASDVQLMIEAWPANPQK